METEQPKLKSIEQHMQQLQDEMQQLGRGQASWGDMVANIAGAVCGALFYLIFSGGSV